MTGRKEEDRPAPEEGAATPGPHRRDPALARRLLPLVVLLALAGGAYALGLDRYLTFEALRDNRTALMSFVEQRMPLAVAGYITIYAATTAVSLPGGAILSVAGGFLFGVAFGTLYVVVGATIGATGVFLIARSVLGSALRQRAGPFLKKMEAGFQENAFHYLLVLRLIPLFPFFVVNLVPAFLGVGLRTYVAATVVGIIPGAAVFAVTGVGLGSIFDAGETFSVTSVLTPQVIAAMVGLALLALLPVAYKKLKARGAI